MLGDFCSVSSSRLVDFPSSLFVDLPTFSFFALAFSMGSRNDTHRRGEGSTFLTIPSPIQEPRTPTKSTFTPRPPPVSWSSLPHKPQLFILFLLRLADFLQLASLQTYAFFQLSSLSPALPPAAIATQAGILQGAFTGAQICTAVLWGRVADRAEGAFGGRKVVLMVGLVGTAVSCVGTGFAGSWKEAVAWRVLGGGVNGMVGVM